MRSWIGMLAAALVALCAAPAGADIVVNVDQGASQPLPIAIPVFAGVPVGAQIQAVIAADLARSGLFRPLDTATLPALPQDINSVPGFDAWKAISAQALVTGQVGADADGHLRVNVRLWDVYAGDELLGRQFSS